MDEKPQQVCDERAIRDETKAKRRRIIRIAIIVFAVLFVASVGYIFFPDGSVTGFVARELESKSSEAKSKTINPNATYPLFSINNNKTKMPMLELDKQFKADKSAKQPAPALPATDKPADRVSESIAKIGRFLNDPDLSAPSGPFVDKKVRDLLLSQQEVPVIIVFKENITGREKISEKAERVKRLKKEVSTYLFPQVQKKMWSLNLSSIMGYNITSDDLQKLQSHPLVEAIYYDDVLSTMVQESISLINVPVVHDLLGITGQEASVCLLDNGVDKNHSWLAGRTVAGHDFVNNDADTADDSGNSHGTHLAGIIATVAPNARIVPVKVCAADGTCKASAILSGIDYCTTYAQELNITALSGSFGDGSIHNSTDCPALFDLALDTAVTQGVVPVFASGNDGSEQGVQHPACSPRTISVGASNDADQLWPGTNKGPLLDLLAPGTDITSSAIGGGFVTATGTSTAVPHVAGTLALLREAQGMPLNTTLARALLQETGVNIAGYARIDAFAAANAILDGTNIGIVVAPPNVTYIKVEFKEQVALENFSACSNLSFNHAEVNSVQCPEYNKPARIWFYGLPFVKNIVALRDGVACVACENLTLNGTHVYVDVLGFSTYSISGEERVFVTLFSQGQSFNVSNDSTRSAANVTFNGTGSSTASGQSLNSVGAGDFNNDGIKDIILGQEIADPNAGINGGIAQVFFGPFSHGRSFIFGDTTQNANITINGSGTNDLLGTAVAGGDLNNDSIDDIVVASASNASGTTDGRVFVLFGPFSQGFSIRLGTGFENANVSFNQTENDNVSGVDVADFNNDSAQDIMIGSRNADPGGADLGQVYIFFGPFSHGTSRNFGDTSSQANVTFNGTAGSGSWGADVAAGDLNNDGVSDVLMGAPGGPEQVAAFFGPFSHGRSFNIPAGANVTFNGTAAANDGLGRSVGAGDVNADGIDDVLVGSFLSEPNGIEAGMVFVNFGPFSHGNSFLLLDNSSQTNMTINGTGAADQVGESVEAGADWNNDGSADIFVGGQPVGLGTQANAGQGYILFNPSVAAAALTIEARGCRPGSILTGQSTVCNATVSGTAPFTVRANVTLPNGSVITQTITNISTNFTFNYSAVHFINGVYNVSWSVNDSVARFNQTTDTFTVNLSHCGEVTVNTLLPNNVGSNGTCFTVTSSNVTLDCNGLTIEFDGSGPGGTSGIQAAGVRNITIKDCVIRDINTTGAFGIGINLTSVNASLIINNTIQTNGTTDSYGILVVGSGVNSNAHNNTFANNSIRTQGSGIDNDGFRLNGVREANITTNIIRTDNGTGIALVAVNKTIVTNNSIFTNVTSNLYGVEIVLVDNHNISIQDNLIRMAGTSLAHGVRLSGSGTMNALRVWNNTIHITRGTDMAGIDIGGTGARILNSNISTNFILMEGSSALIGFDDTASTFITTAIVSNRIEVTNGSGNFHLRFFRSNGTFVNKTILNGSGDWINITGMENNLAVNLSNVTFASPNGSINLRGNFTLQNLSIHQSRLNVTQNNAFLNSSNLTFFNTTGLITLNSITFSDPRPIVDFNDDGTFEICAAPQCVEIGFASNVFTFNVSSFTSYSSEATPIAPVIQARGCRPSSLFGNQSTVCNATVTAGSLPYDVVANLTLPNTTKLVMVVSNVSTNFTFNFSTNLSLLGLYNVSWRVNNSQGTANASDNFTVNNSAPTIAAVILNSTDGTNKTFENLTAFPINVSDVDGDNVSVHFDWRVNGTGWSILNLPMTGPFNNGTVNVTFDFSSKSHHAMLDGGGKSPLFNATGGIVGGAYKLDGLNDFMSINDSNFLDPKRFTITLWFNLPGEPFQISKASRKNMTFLTRQNFTPRLGYLIRFQDPNTTSDSIRFRVLDGTLAHNLDFVDNTTAIRNNTWHYLAASFDESFMRLYIDGDEVANRTASFALAASDRSLVIGGNELANDDFFNGTLDEIIIYNRSLSQTQIRAIFNNSAPRYDRIVQEETGAQGENWTAVAVPIDSKGLNGTRVFSNNLTIFGMIVPRGCRPPTLFNNQSTVCNATIIAGDPPFTVNANVTLPNGSVINATVTNQSTNFTFNFSTTFAQLGLYTVRWHVNDSSSMKDKTTDSFTVNNSAPTIAAILLNSTLGTNLTTENLTAFPINISDVDINNVSVNYNWLVNGTSMTVLNLPMIGIFNDGTQNMSFDISGFNNHALLDLDNDPPIFNATGGIIGGALIFDGHFDELIINDSNSLDPPRFTITLWINMPGEPFEISKARRQNMTFLSRANTTLLTGYFLRFQDVNATNDGIRFSIFNGTTQNNLDFKDNTTAIRNNTWHFIAASFDQQFMRLYIDAEEVANRTATFTLSPSNTPLIIAGNSNDDNDFFNGTMDEIIIYNRSLTQAQLRAIFNNSQPRYDRIVPEETGAPGENWTAIAVPVDNEGLNGTRVFSNNLTIREPGDTTLPSVFDVRPAAGSTFNVTNVIEIAANVTDDVAVDKVLVNVTFPNGSVQQLTLTNLTTSAKYNISFVIPEEFGQYNITFIANDTSNNINASVTTFFIALGHQIFGNASNVNTTGFLGTLNITVNGSTVLTGNRTRVQFIEFFDSASIVVNASHNFSRADFNLSRVTIQKFSTGIIINVSDQLNGTLRLFLNDTACAFICAKNAEVPNLGNITNSCTGASETLFSKLSCQANTTKNGLTCRFANNTWSVDGLGSSGLECAVSNTSGIEGANATRGITGSFNASSLATAVTLQAGNQTQLNLSKNVSSNKWHGFFGSTEGSLRLGLGTSIFYDLTNPVTTTVFVAQDKDFDFSNLKKANASLFDRAFSFNDTADADQAQDIFNTTATLGGVLDVPIVVLNNTWRSGIFDNGRPVNLTNPGTTKDYVFGVDVVKDQQDFRGSISDYELLVAVNSSSPDTAGTETYFFFMDIS